MGFVTFENLHKVPKWDPIFSRGYCNFRALSLSELFLGITPFAKNKGVIPNVENHQNFAACGGLFQRYLIFERFSAF